MLNKSGRMRTIRPQMGSLGLLGFMGFQYFSGRHPSALVFFAFFGFFSYYWWGKLAAEQTDERLIANRNRASHMAMGIAFPLIFVGNVLIANLVGADDPAAGYALLTAAVSLSFALAVNLSAYLTYRYHKQA